MWADPRTCATVLAICCATTAVADGAAQAMPAFLEAAETLFGDPGATVDLNGYARHSEPSDLLPDAAQTVFTADPGDHVLTFNSAAISETIVRSTFHAGSMAANLDAGGAFETQAALHAILSDRFTHDPGQSQMASIIVPTEIYVGCLAGTEVLVSSSVITVDGVSFNWGVEIATSLIDNGICEAPNG